MGEKVRDALDRMEALLDPERGLLTLPERSATVMGSRADMALIRKTVAQHERIVAGLEARLAETRGLLIDARFVISTPSHTKEAIDSFLAQTAEGV